MVERAACGRVDAVNDHVFHLHPPYRTNQDQRILHKGSTLVILEPNNGFRTRRTLRSSRAYRLSFILNFW